MPHVNEPKSAIAYDAADGNYGTAVSTTLQNHTMPMSAFDDAMPLGQILFSFKGRVPRATWWRYGVLGPLLFSLMAELLLGIVGVSERSSNTIVNLCIVWPCVAVAVKRWHDRDKAGGWVLINLIPVLGLLWSLLENGLLRGTQGANRFGADLTGQL